ncbi:nuclear transport factor 2 family protein [Streptomyces bangladeshensis]|uniref:SnoaL-like domain-containing protein n=2 Tax=Streptomyces TaxID=1883 RepID=A0ABN3BYS5_9ACTN
MRTTASARLAAAALALVAGGTAAGCDAPQETARDAVTAPAPTVGAPTTPPVAPPISPSVSPAGSHRPLHPAARRYLDTVADRDAAGVAAAFAPDGLVVDVGREIRGRDAIRRWAAAEVIGGAYTLLDRTPHPGGTTLLVRFRPGGTGDGFRARYRLDLTDGLITRATLEYA